jgi:MerR family copper efflux transcriptional regulator
VHIETLRYYERRVHFIKRAQELGFSLKDIKELLSLQAAPEAECGEIRAHAEAEIKEIDAKIGSLMAMKSALSKLVTECSGQGPLTDCPILESLDTTEVTR